MALQHCWELFGLISVTHYSSQKKFNIVLHARVDDKQHAVQGKFHAKSEFRPERVVGVAMLTGAAIANGIHRAIDQSVKPISMP